jgi:Tol biopolymer transport system component
VCDWSPDGKTVLADNENDRTNRSEIWQLSIDPSLSEKSAAHKIVGDPNYDLWQAHVSRDGRWIVFEGLRSLPTIYTIPVGGGPWIQITDGKQSAFKPRWSPDGKTIYFLSWRKGFSNLWGVHFDPVKRRPLGEPFQVTSFETPTLMIPSHLPTVEFSLTDGRLLLPVAQTSGNIWILDNVHR